MTPDTPTDYPTSIRLPPDLKRKLEQHARVRRQPLSLLVVRVLELWLQSVEKQK